MKTFLLCLLALTTFAFAEGTELEGTRAAANTPCPSPEEARAKMSVPEGYEVRNFAHEPMIVNPVAMTWDSRGRLWVVEGYEYPNGSEFKNNAFGMEAKDDHYHPVPAVCQAKDNPMNAMRADHPQIPKDRVIILEDTDNDGVADKRTVFLEGLDMGSAILCGDGGVYVGQQPHLLHFRDNDGDDHADEWRVVLTGFGREDTHELLNSFCWGPDGWLYMTHGVFTNSKVRRPGVPEKDGFKFDAGIGRCRPVGQVSNLSPSPAGVPPAPMAGRIPAAPATGETPVPHWEFEVFADGTSNPWGCDYDARGNFFVSACVIDHFFHMAPGGIYVRQGGAPENPYAYEQLPSIVTHKHFRAAYAGVTIYQGGVYPQDTWGHAFIGNIHDNAIHEEVLTPVGSTFKCEPRRDFLRANDGWFRPVSTQTGPDGNLWIMDWCDKYPCYQNAKANPEGVDRERGRIWRIVHASDERSADTPVRNERPLANAESGDARAGKSARAPVASRPKNDMDLAKLSTPELVKLLEHPNSWMRRKARRVLVERRDVKATAESISKVADDAPVPVKLECLYTMSGIGAADGKLLTKLVANAEPALRAWSARLTGENWRDVLVREPTQNELSDPLNQLKAGGETLGEAKHRLSALTQDPDPSVRLAAAVALRQWAAGCLTVNRLTVLSRALKPGALILDSLFFTLARDEWTIGATPGFVCLFNEKDYEPGKPVKRQPGDQLMKFMAWQAIQPVLEKLGGRGEVMFPINAGSNNPIVASAQVKACLMASESGDTKRLGIIVRAIGDQKLALDLAACLEAVLKGQRTKAVRPAGELTPILAKWTASDNPRVSEAAQQLAILWKEPKGEEFLRTIVFDQSLSAQKRIDALELARQTSPTVLKDALYRILYDELKSSPELALAAIRLLPRLPSQSNPVPWLTEHWKSDLSPTLRVAAAEAVASRADWSEQLLKAIDNKALSRSELPMTAIRSLTKSKDAEVRKHAEAIYGSIKESSDDIKALIAAKKKACLEGEPDLAAGKLLFTTTCMVCHTFHGGGQKVGPELIGSGRSNLDAILANVIDPNQIIGNGYENIIVTTKDNRTLMGRITEDTPSHVKLLAIGGAEQIVPRDQIAKLENTHQSLMPMGFGGLPDDQFRNLIWYVLAPPEEGPLTPDKKKLLSTSIDAAPAKPKRTDWRSIDWESVSLWNPQWKVSAPEFEGTPTKRSEYHERSNVLIMHPFEDRKTPTALEQKLTVDATKSKLKFSVAADDRGDWQLRVLVNKDEIKRVEIGHDTPRWKDITLDLVNYAGKEVTVRLEGHATGWSYEFSYWHNIRWE